MRFLFAAATALLALTVQAKTLATYTRDGVVYTVESSQWGAEVICHDEMDACPNPDGHVPDWLIRINEWAQDQGFEAPIEHCGDIRLCPNENGYVPAWLEKLNQWFLNHGFTPPHDEDIYRGGA